MRLVDATVDELCEALRTLVRQELEAVLMQRLGEPKRFLTVGEAAQLLRVGPHVLYDAIRRGELHPLKVGRQIRFRPQELEQWAESRAG